MDFRNKGSTLICVLFIILCTILVSKRKQDNIKSGYLDNCGLWTLFINYSVFA